MPRHTGHVLSVLPLPHCSPRCWRLAAAVTRTSAPAHLGVFPDHRSSVKRSQAVVSLALALLACLVILI